MVLHIFNFQEARKASKMLFLRPHFAVYLLVFSTEERKIARGEQWSFSLVHIIFGDTKNTAYKLADEKR